MAENGKNDAIIQNLKDAGCEPDFIRRFLIRIEKQQAKYDMDAVCDAIFFRD